MLGSAAGAGIVLVRPPAESGTPQPSTRDSWRKRLVAQICCAAKSRTSIRFWRAAPGSVPVLAVLPAADVSFGLDAADDPASPFGKEMRKVYDKVRASRTAPRNPSVLVVAADDEDDTATVALTLAAVAAATATRAFDRRRSATPHARGARCR